MRLQFPTPIKGFQRRTLASSKQLFLKYAPDKMLVRARSLLSKWRKFNRRRTEAHGYPAYDPARLGAPGNIEPHFPYTVGTILDPFSESAWSNEFHLLVLTPANWRSELGKCDFILAESAWEGSNGSWQYQLTGGGAPSAELHSLLGAASNAQIPTVFWNKEDPVHFPDFLDTAKLFDYVFTTDAEVIPAYLKEVGHDRVFVLPFAAQPRIHNPARRGLSEDVHRDGVAFAGTYFRHKFENRREQMDILLGAAANVAESYDVPFTIFSRHAGGELKYQFPFRWSKYVTGALAYPQMLTAYHRFALFLNVNSVTTSPSMCARRIFEIIASGTPVLSTPSEAIRNFFSSDEVPVVSEKGEAERAIRSLVNSPQITARMAHLGQRRIWENHTFKHRAATLLDAMNLSAEPSEELPLVTIICSTNKEHQVQHLIDQVAQQHYPRIELFLAGHGIRLDPEVERVAQNEGIDDIRIFNFDKDKTLGFCLNQLVEHSNGEIIAKFDDDDFYLPNYLRDQVNSLRVMEADLVGKASIYFYLNSNDALARRWPHREHTWYPFVAGATLVGWRRTFERVAFPDRSRGEDTQFLKGLVAKGMHVYSTDRFNYVAVRREAGHTWGISDAEILSHSEVETFGLNLRHVAI